MCYYPWKEINFEFNFMYQLGMDKLKTSQPHWEATELFIFIWNLQVFYNPSPQWSKHMPLKTVINSISQPKQENKLLSVHVLNPRKPGSLETPVYCSGWWHSYQQADTKILHPEFTHTHTQKGDTLVAPVGSSIIIYLFNNNKKIKSQLSPNVKQTEICAWALSLHTPNKHSEGQP